MLRVCRWNYLYLLPAIQKNITYASLDTSSTLCYNKYYYVPSNLSGIFTGRDDGIQKLCNSCLPPKPKDRLTEQKRFVLYGLGGSGKTQACLKFAQDYRER
jgi:Cdc6-like AAA superfamily ATPase